MMMVLLDFFANYLIECMSALFVIALALRYATFHISNDNEAYFSQFTRELSQTINEDKTKGVDSTDVEHYLADMLGRVNEKLPNKYIRQKASSSRTSTISLTDYLGSKHGLIASIQAESSAFNAKAPPAFDQLTARVMNEDKGWTKLWNVININSVTRLLELLPSLFIIIGVFGTFIGISIALPEIAKIDFAHIDASGDILTQFVVKVTFAMNTSIAGIFFSILLTVLNTVFPVEGTRERTFEKVEASLQQLWFHMQKDQQKETTTDKVIPAVAESLDKILRLLEKQNSDIKKQKKAA